MTSTAAEERDIVCKIILTADDLLAKCLEDRSNMVTQDKNLAIRRDCVKKEKRKKRKKIVQSKQERRRKEKLHARKDAAAARAEGRR